MCLYQINDQSKLRHIYIDFSQNQYTIVIPTINLNRAGEDKGDFK